MNSVQVLLVLCSFVSASFQYKEIVSIEGQSLVGHVVTSLLVPNLEECMWECSGTAWCKSITYNYGNQSCALNNVTKEQHPDDYVAKDGFAYCDGFNERASTSCAKIKEKYPNSKSGDYSVFVGNRTIRVYCDMEKHGGGWTLVVKINKDKQDHLERGQKNCGNCSVCVPFVDESADQVAQKLDDEDIKLLANMDGVFRIDVIANPIYTKFLKIVSGANNFDSSCDGLGCPRMIVSAKYPYEWLSDCKGIQVGYQIAPHHKVFDTYSDVASCPFFKAPGDRVLYSYKKVNGIHPNLAGLMYVK